MSETYNREQLKAVEERLEWAKCKTCGNECVIHMLGQDFFEFIKARNIDDMMLPTGNERDGKVTCKDCQYKKSREMDAKLNPKYIRRLAKMAKAIYPCPVNYCNCNCKSRAELAVHIAQVHDRYRMEETLGIKRNY